MSIKRIFSPVLFQGINKKDRYFEGWYYKMVSKSENYCIVFIPGISLAKEKSHCFIQVLVSKKDDNSLVNSYFSFHKKEFSYEDNPFKINVSTNSFATTHFTIDLKDEKLSVKGTIKLVTTLDINRSLMNPNIMGPFGYLNFMECYHGIVSMSSNLKGELIINGEVVSFDGGKGYIEKDWGISFPKSYVWLQSNHFKEKNTSFLFSYADIPFLGFFFKGLICNLIIDNKEYRFATYNRSKIIEEKISSKEVFYKIKKGKYTMVISATQSDQVSLSSPKNGVMSALIKEGISGVISLKLYKKDKLIYDDIGRQAGIEIMK